jgi:hypothetical protein
MTTQRGDAIYWMHDDALTPAPQSCARACYVFDPVAIRHHAYGMQRIAFIYESLLELPVEIYRGDTVEVILALARSCGAARVIAWSTPCPWVARTASRIEQALPIEWHSHEPFVELAGPVDLTRYSRYWRLASPAALKR